MRGNPALFFGCRTASGTVGISTYEEALEEAVGRLECMSEARQREPVSASVSPYVEGAYAVVPADYGTKVDADALLKAAGAVSRLNGELVSYAALRRGAVSRLDGVLVLESDFVSGDHSKGRDTPIGAFGVTYKDEQTRCCAGRATRRPSANGQQRAFRHARERLLYDKVQDIQLTATLLERVFGLATLTCYTGDVTDSEL